MPNLDEEERRKREILQRLMQGPDKWKASEISPEEMRQLELGDSAMKGIQLDPRLQDAQEESLGSLKSISDRGGRTLQEDANLNRTRFDVNQEAARRDQGILQDMAQRGISSGGAELAARLQGSASAGQRESQASMDAASSAELRALNALQQRGTMAGNMQDADYGRKANEAKAADEIARFNSDTARGFQQANMNARNQAAAQNTAAGNSWNMDTSKLNYDDAVQSQNRKISEEEEKQKRKSQKSSGVGQIIGGVAGGVAGFYGGGPAGAMAGASAGSQLGGAAGNYFSDERLKKDIKPVPAKDVDEFLKTIDPKTFNYSEPLKNLRASERAQMAGKASSDQAFRDLAQRAMKSGGELMDRAGEEWRKTTDAHHQAEKAGLDQSVDARMTLVDKIKKAAGAISEEAPRALSDMQLSNRAQADAEQEVKSSLNPLSWLTKPRAQVDDGGSQNVGPMAQDLERSKMGQKIVQDTPEGKTLDNQNLMGAILASLKRIDQKKRNK